MIQIYNVKKLKYKARKTRKKEYFISKDFLNL